ncbi:hypothetical protein QTJ16_001604 [Diplocarpon rosae]|uniref:Alpha-1,3-mannosyltransferase CMT1 n=1 Tax=Diplocarpon rosae TaxID=946125 RepID=A0AAD9WGK7_9HELO|nr:hypothetical protein QTJ16_001604 [Diplocarpon rosae]
MPMGDRHRTHVISNMLLASLRRRRRLKQAFILISAIIFMSHSLTHSSESRFYSGHIFRSDGSSADSELRRGGNATLLAAVPAYIKAIMDPKDTTFARLECPQANSERYGYLKSSPADGPGSRQKYFFALDLRDCANILPRLLGSIVETMNFLGPERCSLSIVEGQSEDGTFEILNELREAVERIGAAYHFVSTDLDPLKGERITILAEIRNLALKPLVQSLDLSDTTVIFLNDVALCSDDILELIHQRVWQGADMTCGMDWTYLGEDPTFYDVWIACGMTGDSFFDIPADGNWDLAWDLFWNDPGSLDKFANNQAFQVFSCWNGATAFTAKALAKIQFRRSHENECYQGEPRLFCKDMWFHGFGKIAVVPTVNIEYSDEGAKKIKSLKGHVADLLSQGDPQQRIEWATNPPEKIKCMRNYDDQVWVPWNEDL